MVFLLFVHNFFHVIMVKPYNFIFLLMLLWCCLGFSQIEKKVEDLHKLYIQNRNNDLVQAYNYASKAVQLNDSIKNDSLYAVSRYYLAEILYRKELIPEATSSAEEAVAYSKITNNKRLTCLSYIILSRINRSAEQYSIGLQNLEKAIQEKKEIEDPDLLHMIRNVKGVLFRKTKSSKKSIKIFKESLANPKFTNSHTIGSTYLSLGGTYQTINRDSSIYFYQKGLHVLKDSDDEYLKALFHMNLGDVFIRLCEYEQAFKHLEEAETISKKISWIKGVISVKSSIAVYYHSETNYKEAIKRYLETLNLYGKYMPDRQRAHLYWYFSEALYFDKQYQEAFIYQDKYIDLSKTLFTIEKSKTFERLQTEYEVEKKNDQIAHLQEKQELEAKQRKLILGVGGLVSGILLLLVFMYRYRSRSQKTIREKEQQLFLQEKEQLQQSEKIKRIEGYIEGEEKEKNRIAMELHDGIGGQLAGIQHFVTTLPKSTATGVLRQNISMISKEVRLLSHSLSSSFSEIQPLTHLLQTLQSQYQNHFDLQINVYPEEEIKNLSTTQKVFLYRSIQEIINNIYKHADATSVVLSLTISEEVVLMIEDNGKGFDMHKTAKGIGLQNIKDKTAYAKGEITIDSKLGQGTTVIIKIQKEYEEDKYSSS